MRAKIFKLLKILRESGFIITVEKLLSYLGLSLDLKNSIKFRDPRIAFSCDINKKLPDSTIMGHPVGIVIHGSAEVGENVRIYQNVTIGCTLGDETQTAPTIGDDVTIYSGAAIIDNVNIGKGAVVGSNAVVLDDVDGNATVVGAPAREV